MEQNHELALTAMKESMQVEHEAAMRALKGGIDHVHDATLKQDESKVVEGSSVVEEGALSWTAKSWLASSTAAFEILGLHLQNEARASGSQADKVKSLTQEDFRRAIRKSTEALAEEFTKAVAILNEQTVVDASELNTKFEASNENFTFVYAGMDAYHAGLEGLIGNPDPNIMEAMLQEHVHSAYSALGFKCWGVFKDERKTTARAQWEYVVDQVAKEDGKRERGRGGWSLAECMKRSGKGCVELVGTKQTGRLVHKPVVVTGGTKGDGSKATRQGQLLDPDVMFKGGKSPKFANGLELELNKMYEVRITGKNEHIVFDGSNLAYSMARMFVPGENYEVVLHETGETVVVDGEGLVWHDAVFRADLQKAEVIAGRLYTGPMYMFYNHVLRWMNQPSLKDDDFLEKGQSWGECKEKKVWPAQWKLVRMTGGSRDGLYGKLSEAVPDRFDQKKEYTVITIEGSPEEKKHDVEGKYLATVEMFEIPFVTTIHVLNSLILKLSRIQAAAKVYRGTQGGVLPKVIALIPCTGCHNSTFYVTQR
jgi:hypothetical protein